MVCVACSVALVPASILRSVLGILSVGSLSSLALAVASPSLESSVVLQLPCMLSHKAADLPTEPLNSPRLSVGSHPRVVQRTT
ncbi:hypothetical protein PF002_g30728 [Phytophthora fragariae]|uniref:Uncharacterized protein n=1 Tax=Phytophthora fragariae TaxID=53985 RepID=A0A6A3PGK4_9STRA|nr:hypothetical protein PF003_g27523 [Phytophthora fragariae]KAE8958044.1 hypothetical protein PF011_g30925 [Phytophthora fragariae]KAE9056770.1 hypothetical protein PF007_g31879 [Phytophthora fragariae]KAE9060301.1 hypothetical protein PF006_g31672 [Phytophthora fragariae]KAE9167997.1 hypothetical protein PF002_g30728 [Phytophthora fragariae]